MRLDLKEIQAHINNNEIYQKGIEIYKNGLIKNITVQYNKHTNCSLLIGEISETKRTKYTAIATFDEEKQKFVRFHCDCVVLTKNNEICPHMAAALIAAYYKEHPEEILEEAKPDQLVSDAEQLIQFYSNDYEKSLMLQDQNIDVTIIPQLEQIDKHVYVFFKLQHNKKQYIVRSLEDFVQALQERKSISYGKELTFIHHTEAFTNPELLLFLLREFENRKINETYAEKNINAKHMYLNPSAFDEFFWRFVKDKINYKSQGKEELLHVHSILPHISLVIEEKEDNFVLRLRKPMQYISGSMYGYYIC